MADFAIRVDTIKRFIKYREEWVVYHLAKKKLKYYIPPLTKNENGRISDEHRIVNKFEKFIFDPFKLIHPKRFGLL